MEGERERERDREIERERERVRHLSKVAYCRVRGKVHENKMIYLVYEN